MENLTVQVMNQPVIVYPNVQLAEEESKGGVVEGFIQFDLASFHDLELKVRLSGTERQKQMLSMNPKMGEIELVHIGQSAPILNAKADLTYMFLGGAVPTSSLHLQPGNHIFAFSGRIPHTLPSSQSNGFASVAYEAMVLVNGKKSTGWPSFSLNKSATTTFEMRVNPSVAGPNEVNKMEIRLHPQGENAIDVPFRAFARSNNARLGGCMDITLTIPGPLDSDFRFQSVTLELEQHISLNSLRHGHFEQLLCSHTIIDKKEVPPRLELIPDPTVSTLTASGNDTGFKSNTQEAKLQRGTLNIHGDFPRAGTPIDAATPNQEWIATTPPKTQASVRISHRLKLTVKLAGTAGHLQYEGESWQLFADVVLVDDRMQTLNIQLPEYSL